jgi:hypothetical protein
LAKLGYEPEVHEPKIEQDDPASVRSPMSVVGLTEAVGMGKISRALAGLASGKLVSRAYPRDNRDVLVWLTRTGLVAHDAMMAGALERNHRLQEQLGEEEVAVLLGHLDRLTDTAARMLDAETDLN